VQFFRETLFQSAKISQQQFIIMAALLSAGLSDGKTALALGLTRASVREWRLKLFENKKGRNALPE